MLIKKKCRICNTTFMVSPQKSSRAYCDAEACREIRKQQYQAKQKRLYRLKKGRRRTAKPRPATEGQRSCRRCGRSCYPNYFFCNTCHPYVSDYDWNSGQNSCKSC